jgi:hypothetical protein
LDFQHFAAVGFFERYGAHFFHFAHSFSPRLESSSLPSFVSRIEPTPKTADCQPAQHRGRRKQAA